MGKECRDLVILSFVCLLSVVSVKLCKIEKKTTMIKCRNKLQKNANFILIEINYCWKRNNFPIFKLLVSASVCESILLTNEKSLILAEKCTQSNSVLP